MTDRELKTELLSQIVHLQTWTKVDVKACELSLIGFGYNDPCPGSGTICQRKIHDQWPDFNLIDRGPDQSSKAMHLGVDECKLKLNAGAYAKNKKGKHTSTIGSQDPGK